MVIRYNHKIKTNHSIIIKQNYSKITFKYNDNIISCELEGDTTLENIFEYMIETLNIRE
jgi:predicted ATP-grasp superfamily ATP-dependent carboligase